MIPAAKPVNGNTACGLDATGKVCAGASSFIDKILLPEIVL
ncbi:Uncharacterised protein [Mycobacteroides abscessus subsp. massiliense]|nr:Uncharacterised protein [Mycobacteroides abscessus subsp. massiliense]